MKNTSLKNIFATAAITVGMMFAANESEAQYSTAGTLAATSAATTASSVVNSGDKAGEKKYDRACDRQIGPWDNSYDSQLTPARLQFLNDIREAIADPGMGAKEIKKILGGAEFGDFDSDDLQHYKDVREEVVGQAFRKASGAEVDRMMKRMDQIEQEEDSSQRLSMLLGGFVLMLLGPLVAVPFAHGNRPKTHNQPKVHSRP